MSGYWKGKKLSASHRLKLSLSHRGIKQSEESKRKKGKAIQDYFRIHGHWNKGKHLNAETKRKISLGGKGLKRSALTCERIRQAQIGSHHSAETKRKLSQINLGKKLPYEVRLKMRERMLGDKNPAWRGGLVTEKEKARKCMDYIDWRKAVFERDNFTCIWCYVRGGRLNADHIKPWALHPDLRFKVDNGRTLCENCHKKTDTYGWKTYKVTLKNQCQNK